MGLEHWIVVGLGVLFLIWIAFMASDSPSGRRNADKEE